MFPSLLLLLTGLDCQLFLKHKNLKRPYNSDSLVLNYDIIESMVIVKQNEIFRVSSPTQ